MQVTPTLSISTPTFWNPLHSNLELCPSSQPRLALRYNGDQQYWHCVSPRSMRCILPNLLVSCVFLNALLSEDSQDSHFLLSNWTIPSAFQAMLKLGQPQRHSTTDPPARNTVSYSAAISACEKAGNWSVMLLLLEEMRLSNRAVGVGGVTLLMPSSHVGNIMLSVYVSLCEISQFPTFV